ncbi:MAG: hypothetical protein GY846_07915 [Deltaproteobacteria bacterium]|nr:hypothetical protein [Deltaproteobacteria bacterium]
MGEFLKTTAGYLVVAGAAFLIGLFVAISSASNQTCFLELKWGENYGIKLGKNRSTEYDLNKNKKKEAQSLGDSIRDLSYDHALSFKLRDLRDCCKGPFENKNIDLVVKLTDNKKIPSGIWWAEACEDKEVLNKVVNITEIIEPSDIPNELKFRMREFQVGYKRQSPDCRQGPSAVSTIWITKECARTWLDKNIQDLPLSFKVKADIMRKIACPL